jgi:hypothetical protein
MLQLSDSELKIHLDNRSNAPKLLAGNANYFGALSDSKIKAVFPLKYNTAFEELGCIGYQPILEELTATIKITRTSGYGGNLCSNGSLEYVRFFLDYGNGTWQDMGMTAVNVHDLPDSKDCDGAIEKPISYVVRLKIDPKQLLCSTANLPKLRAILSWNTPLAANMPNPIVAWGDMKEAQIQIAPMVLLKPNFPLESIGSLLTTAIQNPTVSLANIASTSLATKDKLSLAQNAILSPKVELAELNSLYTSNKIKVEPERIGAKILNEAIVSKNQITMLQNQSIFTAAGLDWASSIKNFLALNGNTSYEQLYCVGLDYQKEALVASLNIKKSSGYSGGLCTNGSKEYVGFWIQTDVDCAWHFAGSAFVNVFDIAIPANGLAYSVVLPFDFSKYRNPCGKPTILKVRAVLSWNVAPSSTDPKAVPYWGNIVDSYIQIAPGKGWDGKNPVMITLGGLSVDNINATTGLSKPGAKFEFNQAGTYDNSPFAGTIVMQGLSAPLAGMKYRVKVHNLATNQAYYLNSPLVLLGYNTSTNQITHPIVTPDANNYYEYKDYLNNIDSILARFNPGTNDLLEITLENDNGSSVSQRIQMDSILPQISLIIEKSGCGGYTKGDTINGTFSVNDAYLQSYTLSSSLAPNIYSGTTNVPNAGNPTGAFHFNTIGSGSPCGSINMSATEKTIHDSVSTGYTVYTGEVVCLK